MEEINFEISLDKEKLAKEIKKYISIKNTEQEDHTLSELKQKLINELYKIPVKEYEMIDVEILKVLFN